MRLITPSEWVYIARYVGGGRPNKYLIDACVYNTICDSLHPITPLRSLLMGGNLLSGSSCLISTSIEGHTSPTARFKVYH